MNEPDRWLRAQMRADRLPGLSAAVLDRHRVRRLYGFGSADLAEGAPAGPLTAYLWFSMTKIATATAVMRLAERSSIELDTPVTRYVPAFAAVRQPVPVTVRHLLNHTSGLANPVPVRWVHPADSAGPAGGQLLRRLLARHRRLRFPPGSRAGYSNLGYLVLGEVIAQVTGVAYEDAVRDLVLDPLGMRHTGFAYADCGDRPVATGYQPLAAPLTPLLRAVLPAGVAGRRYGPYLAYRPFCVDGAAYGGLIGGVDDAARLVRLHLAGGEADGVRLLSPQSAAAMRRVTARGGRYDFGLGWYRPHRAAGRPFVQHLGGGSGYFSVMRIYPDAGIGVVLMGNATRYDHERIIGTILGASPR